MNKRDGISQKKIVEYDVLRIFATILVVLAHCTYYTIQSDYGGIYYDKLYYEVFSSDTRVHWWINIGVQFIYTFVMPMFIALSGALFHIALQKRKFSNLSELVRNKFYRLIVPFIVVTIFYSVPIKFISGYYFESKNYLMDILLGQICLQGNSHLWFLPTLFAQFILAFIIELKWKHHKKIKLIIFMLANCMSIYIPIKLIQNIVKYLFWFYLGMCFETKREVVNDSLKRHKMECFFSLIIAVALFLINTKILNYSTIIAKMIKSVLGICEGIFGSFACYSLSYYVSKNRKGNGKALRYISRYIGENSLGLYLYADPLNYLILFIVYTCFGLSFFGTESGALIIILVRIFGTGSVAVTLTEVIRISHMKYIC